MRREFINTKRSHWPRKVVGGCGFMNASICSTLSARSAVLRATLRKESSLVNSQQLFCAHTCPQKDFGIKTVRFYTFRAQSTRSERTVVRCPHISHVFVKTAQRVTTKFGDAATVVRRFSSELTTFTSNAVQTQIYRFSE
jgi:hypothetical protein